MVSLKGFGRESQVYICCHHIDENGAGTLREITFGGHSHHATLHTRFFFMVAEPSFAVNSDILFTLPADRATFSSDRKQVGLQQQLPISTTIYG